MNYYNDNDKTCAFWLKDLMKVGLIGHGEIDDRGIQEIRAEDVSDHERVHFFAGIGGWEYALDLAEWQGPVWTGSCPCQPFSNAGRRKGTSDERHLWPEMQRLIAECRPPTVFGEQVASPLGREWLAGVRADLEALGYAVGAADLCAAGVGAPHIRQRLFWLANLPDKGWNPRGSASEAGNGGDTSRFKSGRLRHVSGLADMHRGGCSQGRQTAEAARYGGAAESEGSWSDADWLADMQREGLAVGTEHQDGRGTLREQGKASIEDSAWSDYYIVQCADGKARRVGSGIFPLAHGVQARVAKLRGLGNAIVPQIAAEFVRAFMEVI